MRRVVRTGAVLAAAALVAGATWGGLAAGTPAGASPASPKTVSFTFTAGLAGVSVSGGGAVDLSARTAQAQVNVPAALASHLPGAGDAATAVDLVLSGGTLYVSYPGLAGVDGGRPWVSVAVPATIEKVATQVAPVLYQAATEVSEIVAFARAHGATVTPLGTAVVDGVTATGTQITATVSGLTAARDTAPAPAHRAGVRKIAKALAQVVKQTSLSGGLTVDLWADAADHLVRLTATAGGVSVQADLSGYGTPVSVTVPPPSATRPVPASVVAGVLGGR